MDLRRAIAAVKRNASEHIASARIASTHYQLHAADRKSIRVDPSAMAAIRGCVIDEIDHLCRNASHSPIVRHHWSRALASSYLEGVEDVMDACNSTGIFEVDDAVFTPTERPTRADWPAAMIIYVAEITPHKTRSTPNILKLSLARTDGPYPANCSAEGRYGRRSEGGRFSTMAANRWQRQ